MRLKIVLAINIVTNSQKLYRMFRAFSPFEKMGQFFARKK